MRYVAEVLATYVHLVLSMKLDLQNTYMLQRLGLYPPLHLRSTASIAISETLLKILAILRGGSRGGLWGLETPLQKYIKEAKRVKNTKMH